MRNLLLILLLGCTIAACKQPVKGKNGVSYDSAVEYNDYIVERQTNLMKNVLEFGNMEDSEMDSAESYLRRYAGQAETMIHEIKGMPAYKGDTSLRDAAVRSFSFYKRIFEKDYMDLLQIRKKGEDNITPEDVAEANRIVDKIGKEEEGYDEAFRKAQENYAAKNHMKLTDNKIQKEVDKLGKDN
ncbi:MAG TPA: hypothetical protein VGO58_03430 [Chitinophagaceae bacterium]|jgi:hypothetical protein|nr:hypothetical protein [Chitinophagaceae bacterium]